MADRCCNSRIPGTNHRHVGRPMGNGLPSYRSGSRPPANPRKTTETTTETRTAETERSRQVYLISPSGGEAFPITMGRDEVHAFTWSADSKMIYFATRVPWNKDQNEAYKKVWKDTVLYRRAER